MKKNIDPTRFDLLKAGAQYLAGWGLEKSSRLWAIEEAIYWFASQYHSGQWTNLYSVLSTSDFKPSILANEIEDEIAQEIFDHYERVFWVS